MLEETGDIWDSKFDGCWRIIPINCQINSRGELIMGRGLAKDAKERYPTLPKEAGRFYGRVGESFSTMFPEYSLILFPTKVIWKSKSNIGLIRYNLAYLKELFHSLGGSAVKIVCPRLGCGVDTGQLDWEREVRPLVLKYFGDNDNFVVVSL